MWNCSGVFALTLRTVPFRLHCERTQAISRGHRHDTSGDSFGPLATTARVAGERLYHLLRRATTGRQPFLSLENNPAWSAQAPMQITAATLKALTGFRDLDRETFDAVEAISRLIEVPGDAILCRQGAPPEQLHYLLDGQVALTQTAANGDVAVIDVLRPVSGIALATVVTGLTHQMTARTLTTSRLLAIRAAPLRALIGLRSSLAATMLQGLSLDLNAVTRHVIDLKLRTAAQRLGCYLLRQAHDCAGSQAEFRLPISKRLLAGQIGCRHESLSRAFMLLREVGVETRGGWVVLRDIDRLRRYAALDDPMPETADSADLLRSAQAFSDAFNLR